MECFAPMSLTGQGSYLAIAIAAILPGQVNHIGCQPFVILSAPGDFTLRRAVLPERRTGVALRDMRMFSNVLNTGATTRGA